MGDIVFTMQKLIYLALCLALLSCASTRPSFIPKDAHVDKALLGIWGGFRSKKRGCPVLAWKMLRRDDFTYTINFYADPERLYKTGQETGYWWVAKSYYHEQAAGVAQPDTYTYLVVPDMQSASYTGVSFSERSTSMNAACIQGGYTFKDERIEP